VTHDLAPVIDDTLLRGELVGSGFVQQQPLRRMVAEQRGGKRDWSKQLWELLTLETWYRNMRSAGVGSR
jgi:asparagine synthase (glutamine-hydrolysing)